MRRDLAERPGDGRAIEGLPFVPQPPRGCGPAALTAVLRFHGIDARPEELRAEELLPSSVGTYTYELALAARRRGLFARDVRMSCEGDPSPMRRLAALIEAELPVVVLLEIGPPLFRRYHYVAATGYDDARGYVLYQDGYDPDGVEHYDSFQEAWHRGDHWALVVFPPERTFPFLSADDRRELAALCEARGSWDAAGAHLKEVLAGQPQDQDARVGLASALSRGGRSEEATREFERALAQRPGDARAMNNFAQHLVRCGGDLQRAEELARAAHAAAPELAGDVQDTLGQVLAARRDLPGARAAFEAALAALRPDQEATRLRIRARLDALPTP